MKAKLVIEMDEIGTTSISGNIENKILAYGMLEMAKDLVRDHVAKNQQAKTSSIIKPTGNEAGQILKNGS